jgi:hypothetical protein
MSKASYLKYVSDVRHHFASCGITDYFIDGPVTDRYWDETTRICILNLEAYGYEGCGESLLDQKMLEGWMCATGTVGSKRIYTKTTRYTSVYVAALLESITGQQAVDAADLRSFYPHIEHLKSVMSRIAYVNIRKTSNPIKPQDILTIRSFTSDPFLQFIRQQINALDPHIIVTSGEEGCIGLNRIMQSNTEPGVSLQYGQVVRGPGGQVLQSVRHFSRPGGYSRMAAAVNACVSAFAGEPESGSAIQPPVMNTEGQ